ncbi:hypothetical protein DVH24_028084 [Malus domestica]|uniref:Protein kinase domain-containing protein n=1 Tax=Malus domestica TaxID=3750 RepID=A0A498HF26_MALDO|nr:hypothetical protein DVH24_028084 [Malus domestica]
MNQASNWGRKIRLALQTAKAIDILHSSSPHVIHRDIKSANIWRTEDVLETVLKEQLQRFKVWAMTVRKATWSALGFGSHSNSDSWFSVLTISTDGLGMRE